MFPAHETGARRAPRTLGSHRLVGALFAAALFALTAAPAGAHEDPRSITLNDPVASNQYLSVTNKTGLEGHANYTLEAWVFPTSYTGTPTIFGNDFLASYWLGLTTGGKVRFYPRGGVSFDGVGVVPLNRWTHVAVTYNSTTGSKIYLNGALDASNTTIVGAPGTSTGDLRIGADRILGSPSYAWKGSLRELRIWSLARTQFQIQQMMFIHPPGGAHSPGLEAVWRFDYASTITPLRVFDEVTASASNSAYLTNFTTSPGSTWGTPSRGIPMDPHTAVTFDGTTSYFEIPGSPCCPIDGTRLTLMAWIAPSALTGYQTIVGRDFTSSYWFGIRDDGGLRFYPRGLAGLSGAVDSPGGVVRAAHWQHVAVTYDQDVTRFYVNGREVSSSSAITGPVQLNARPIRVGADGSTTPAYFYRGSMDQVRVYPGVLSAEQIAIHSANAQETGLYSVQDASGVSNYLYNVTGDGRDSRAFPAWSGAVRHVRSGIAVGAANVNFLNVSPTVTPGLLNVYPMYTLPLSDPFIVGGAGVLPDDTSNVIVTSDQVVDLDKTIENVRVYVLAPIENLATSYIQLRSPAGTWVTLHSGGGVVGRNLYTIFEDGAATTLTSGFAPFAPTSTAPSVAPRFPLAAFAGQNTRGTWRLVVGSGASADKVGLWAWGLSFGRTLSVDAEGRTPENAVTLAIAGANPARGRGALTFTLPADAQARLELLDISGRRAGLLHDARTPAGRTTVNWADPTLAPGVYYARLSVDGRAAARTTLIVTR